MDDRIWLVLYAVVLGWVGHVVWREREDAQAAQREFDGARMTAMERQLHDLREAVRAQA